MIVAPDDTEIAVSHDAEFPVATGSTFCKLASEVDRQATATSLYVDVVDPISKITHVILVKPKLGRGTMKAA